jgi:hypothetical protein
VGVVGGLVGVVVASCEGPPWLRRWVLALGIEPLFGLQFYLQLEYPTDIYLWHQLNSVTHDSFLADLRINREPNGAWNDNNTCQIDTDLNYSMCFWKEAPRNITIHCLK